MPRQPGTYAIFNTSEGTIVCRLFEKDAPKTVANFTELAEGKRDWTHPVSGKKTKDRLYDGTIFHRVIPNFMIQGGDPAGTGFGGPEYQRLAILHHDCAHPMAHRQAHHFRRSGRGTGCGREDRERPPQSAR